MAASRDRRSNAGARMSRLLEAEDDDDFYKTTYGGFSEEADDNDYQTEDSASDHTDSDIDLDENDEVKSDTEDAGDGKRKRRLVTKAYKEPKKLAVDESEAPVPREKTKPERVKSEKPLVVEVTIIDKTSLRKSTSAKTRSTEDCLREREARASMLKQIAEKKRVPEVRRLTQEELLAEAKITEKINLRSLATYQKLELEKKKSRAHRQTYFGPFIRYHSVTVPAADDNAPEVEINVDSFDSDQAKPTRGQSALSTEKCSRTFITFGGDSSLYRRHFPQRRPPRPAVRSTCPVTGKPAIYYDPLSETPYATVEAFRIIRAAFRQQQQQAADAR